MQVLIHSRVAGLLYQSTFYFADSFFASVKTAKVATEKGHEFVGPVKNCHSLYPQKEINALMQHWPGGTNTVFECTELGLVAVGYKYNKKKVLNFIMTKGAGSTKPGVAYQAHYNDPFGNQCTRDILRPDVISNYFQYSNTIDIANRVRQSELALEQLWLTKNCWFRLDTTFLGIVVTDCYHALHFGLPSSHAWKNIDMRLLAGLLAKDFRTKAALCSDDASPGDNFPMRRIASDVSVPSIIDVATIPSPVSTMTTEVRQTVLRPPFAHGAPQVPTSFCSEHYFAKLKNSKRAICRAPGCSGKTAYYCIKCKSHYCNGESKDPRWCFFWHVCHDYALQTKDVDFHVELAQWDSCRIKKRN